MPSGFAMDTEELVLYEPWTDVLIDIRTLKAECEMLLRLASSPDDPEAKAKVNSPETPAIYWL